MCALCTTIDRVKYYFSGASDGALSAFKWKPEEGISFLVVNKTNGNLVGRFNGNASFALHHVNAFESKNGE